MHHKNKISIIIEPHFLKDLKSESYEVKTIKASKLLTHTRFDLAFKLLYLEMRNKNLDFAKDIYQEHISAFSLGKITEPGNGEKNNIDNFFDEFDKTFEDIKLNGFDAGKSLIPLSYNNSIANGAHRVASAIFLEKNVNCVQIETNDHVYNYKFFYDRNISSDTLDIVATKFVEYADNLYIACLWPTAKGGDGIIEKIIPNIVYRKEIMLTPNGAHNLLSQIYCGEKWLGNVENNFKGSKSKLLECFKNFDPVRIIAFQANSLNEVLEIKDKVRSVFNIGKHSIHITDTKDESIRVSRVVFNENSIHFLNNAEPNKYLSTHQKLKAFRWFVEKNQLDYNDLVLDSSIILSVYGLREANDIDYFIDENEKLIYKDSEVECHDTELKYHDIGKVEMIFNPKYHFYFNDLKFISFDLLYKMKSKRGERKDINDCEMMEYLVEKNSIKSLMIRLKQYLYYFKIKMIQRLIISMKKYKVYNVVRIIYRLVRGKK